MEPLRIGLLIILTGIVAFAGTLAGFSFLQNRNRKKMLVAARVHHTIATARSPAPTFTSTTITKTTTKPAPAPVVSSKSKTAKANPKGPRAPRRTSPGPRLSSNEAHASDRYFIHGQRVGPSVGSILRWVVVGMSAYPESAIAQRMQRVSRTTLDLAQRFEKYRNRLGAATTYAPSMFIAAAVRAVVAGYREKDVVAVLERFQTRTWNDVNDPLKQLDARIIGRKGTRAERARFYRFSVTALRLALAEECRPTLVPTSKDFDEGKLFAFVAPAPANGAASTYQIPAANVSITTARA